MKLPISRRDVVLAGAATAAVPAFARAQRHRFGILGGRAPKLAVPWWIDAEGEPTQVSADVGQGKWLFLKCFQSWCPGCHSHGFPTLKKVSDTFADDARFVALGIQTVFEGFSTNTRERVREIQLRYDLSIPMGHDAGDPGGDHRPQTMRDYRTGGTPWIIIVDPKGQVVFNDYHLNTEMFITRMREILSA